MSIVLIEDDDADAELVLQELVSAGLAVNVVRATTKAQLGRALNGSNSIDAVLCAYDGEGVKVWQALEILETSRSAAPLIVVSKGLGDEQAAECIRLGATDYILKDRLGRLPHALTQAIRHASIATERREGIQRLRESQAYLSAVIETAPDAVVRMDESGTITDWNSAAQKTFGWARGEVIGRPFSETIISPEFRARHEQGMARFQRDVSTAVVGGHWDTFEGLRKDGEVFPIELAISPPIPLGAATQFVGFVRDISERRRAELGLAESEGRLRSLLAGAPVAVTTLDRDGRFTFVGGTVFSQMQVDPSSPFGLLATEAFGNRPDFLELYERALERDVRADLEFGGRIFHVRCGPFRLTPKGEVVGVRAVALDISERVEAEQRLSRRVSQQTVLLELSRAGLEGRETAYFLAVAVELVARGMETEFSTVFELGPAENCLIRVAAYGHAEGMPTDTIPLDELSLELMESETPVALDYQAPSAPARTQWMIECGVLTSMAVGIRGATRPFGLLAVHSIVEREFSSEDLQFLQLASTIISRAVERRRGEKQRQMLLGRLVTAQEAERKAIAEDIHDDAVQVMTAANMRLELFRMALTDPAQVDAARKLQETVSLAIGRLRNMLFELIPPDLDRRGLAAAFRGHLEQFHADAGLRWDLQAELDEEPSQQVMMLLFRIFQEALVNVRKHAQATTVSVSLTTLDGGVMMRLSDDGTGFHQSAVEPLAGHLGLASMRERAEIAGGWCRLTSEPGLGTEVLTWVPAVRSDEVTVVPAAEVVAIG